MKPRTLASIGAVLLYLYCEVCQASPFAFGRERHAPDAPPAAMQSVAEVERECTNDLRPLFSRARVAE